METPTVAADKKKAARLGAHIVFADESGFLLIPHVAKTWAPVGQTPIHRHVYRRDKISVISGISVSPKRQRLNLYYYLFYAATCKAAGYDCLTKEEWIKPRISLRVAYEVGAARQQTVRSPRTMYPHSQEWHQNREATVYLPA
jgi:hypothetical protein